jgi:hypothetical protein
MVRQAGFLLLLLAGSAATAVAQDAPGPEATRQVTTLGAALAAAGVDPGGLTAADLAARVADVTIEREESAVLLAGYEHLDGAPHGTIRVMVREGAQAAWRRAAIDAAAAGSGGITQVRRAGAFTLIDTRKDDRTDVMLVLDGSLQLTRTVPGHLLATLPGGTVLLQENTSDYAPSRPVFVALFEPGADTISRIHPLEPWSAPRARFVDRVRRKYSAMNRTECDAAGHHCDPRLFDGAIVSEVRVDPYGTRAVWVERLGPGDGARGPVDFHVYVVVACDRAARASTATCRERAFGTYDGPDGKVTQDVLDSTVASRAR